MKKEYSKGITLIALVITIVILLILAGVSINAIIRENGIMSNARLAKKLTNKETARDKVQVQILDSMNDNGEYDISKVKTNIENKLQVDVERDEETGALTFTYEGFDFEVSKIGIVKILNEDETEPSSTPEVSSTPEPSTTPES